MAQNNDPTCVFCKGYTVNCGHMEIGNLIELAKKGWLNDSHPIFIPMQAINTEKVNALIDEIEVKACACDMMVGYNCGVHEKISDLRDAINHPIKTSVN